MRTNLLEIKNKACSLYFKENVSISEICNQLDVGFVYVISWIHHFELEHSKEFEVEHSIHSKEDERYLIL